MTGEVEAFRQSIEDENLVRQAEAWGNELCEGS